MPETNSRTTGACRERATAAGRRRAPGVGAGRPLGVKAPGKGLEGLEGSGWYPRCCLTRALTPAHQPHRRWLGRHPSHQPPAAPRAPGGCSGVLGSVSSLLASELTVLTPAGLLFPLSHPFLLQPQATTNSRNTFKTSADVGKPWGPQGIRWLDRNASKWKMSFPQN